MATMYYKLAKDSSKGRTILSQAVVMKMLGTSSTAYYNVNKRFPWIFDITHYGYGRIDVKYSSLTGTGRLEGYKFWTNRRANIRIGNKKECDTYFFIGFDRDWENIDVVLVVPNKGWIRDIDMASVYKNTNDSKYNEFITDAKQYNDAYNDLMLFIGDSVVVGVDDVKEWLRGGEK